MKKLLLGAAFMLGAITVNAQDGPKVGQEDLSLYPNVEEYGIYPLWGWYTAMGNQSYGTIGANSRGMAITADGTKMLIPNRTDVKADDKLVSSTIEIIVYSALTGEKEKVVKVSDDIWNHGNDDKGDPILRDNEANDIQVDAAGNVLLWRMSTNIGVSPAECWAVNLEDGSVKNILSATVEGLEGRFDYFGVYGDVVNGDGYLLSATSNGDELYGKTVLRWRYVGGVLQPQDESDQIFITAYYPASAVSNSYGTRVCPVNEDLFYMDAFSSFATLYNMDGTIADSFASITDEATRNAIQPMSAGNNGVAEFSLGGVNYAVYSISNQLDAIQTGLRLVSLNDAMEFSSMKLVYNLPAQGMGNISNPERTVLPRVIVDEAAGIARIVIYCNRGGAVAYDFGLASVLDKLHPDRVPVGLQGNKVPTLRVTSTKGEIVLTENADIEVYDLLGRKIVEKANTTFVKVLPGLYIVKAENAGNVLNTKVVVE